MSVDAATVAAMRAAGFDDGAVAAIVVDVLGEYVAGDLEGLRSTSTRAGPAPGSRVTRARRALDEAERQRDADAYLRNVRLQASLPVDWSGG